MGTPQNAPVRHHIDRRANTIVAANSGTDDELLTTRATADWLGISCEWLEIGRSKNYGPKFTRLSSRVIRYRRGDVLDWLKARAFASTAEYKKQKGA
jgi:predicted DNA-binding transcriptional regulator AlpA